MSRSVTARFITVGIAVCVLFLLNIFIGSVHIPASDVAAILGGKGVDPERYIILESRLPQALTALLAGAGLATAGLLLQSAFRNPLAGPSILGISSGASLGVAVVMLFMGGVVAAGDAAIGGQTAVMLGAFVGAMAVMVLLILLSTWLRNGLLLLITGIMTGYFTSSLIMLLNYSSTTQGVHSYVMWGMGSFAGVAMDSMPFFIAAVIAGLMLALMLIKPLNLLLLGDNYARNLGVRLTLTRNLLMLSTGLLTATVTAYCGPVSFVGLAVPHIARMIWRTDNHAVILPGTMLAGCAITLLCNLLTVAPSGGVLPLNAVTSLIGVPVVVYVVMRRR